MDHHCVFLNNCVGQDNSPYFIRFLVWVATACAYVCTFSSILALKRMDDSGVSIMQIIRHGLHRGGSTGAYGYIPQVFVINNAVHCFITFAEVPFNLLLFVAPLNLLCSSCLEQNAVNAHPLSTFKSQNLGISCPENLITGNR